MSNGAVLTRQERKAQTRSAIIEAASRLFARHGIESTSIDRIAQEIRLTKGAVYAAFRSKRELVEAVGAAGSVLIDIEPLFREDLALRERLAFIARDFNRLRPRVTRELLLLDLEMFLYHQRHKGVREDKRAELHEAAVDEGARLEAVARARNEPLPVPGVELMMALTALARGLAQELVRSPDSLSETTVDKLFVGLAGTKS
jgi:AcrR family transcriptional regulator